MRLLPTLYPYFTFCCITVSSVFVLISKYFIPKYYLVKKIKNIIKGNLLQIINYVPNYKEKYRSQYRQFSPKQFMLDNFYKPISYVTFTILLGM